MDAGPPKVRSKSVGKTLFGSHHPPSQVLAVVGDTADDGAFCASDSPALALRRAAMKKNRNDMIVDHLPLVAFVVNRMPSEGTGAVGIDRDDALSYGIEGLIHAVDAFDPDRGTTFASFAIQRIRGSILDAVRKQDPLPVPFAETRSESNRRRKSWPCSWAAGRRSAR